jgi:hypothetical protein
LQITLSPRRPFDNRIAQRIESRLTVGLAVQLLPAMLLESCLGGIERRVTADEFQPSAGVH